MELQLPQGARSKNFEDPTKLPNESVQKLPWEGGGGSCNFFFNSSSIVSLFIHIMSSFVVTFHPLCNSSYILCNISQYIHFFLMLYNMNEKLKKCLHIMDEKLHLQWLFYFIFGHTMDLKYHFASGNHDFSRNLRPFLLGNHGYPRTWVHLP